MSNPGGRWKFIVGGVMLLAAVGYLIVSSALANSQYYMTVEELQAKGQEMVGQSARISGVVLGDTIQLNPQTLVIHFTVANIPTDAADIERLGGMATVLRSAAKDSSLPRLQVIYHGEKPDLLKDASQAIMTGKLGTDGFFYADELLLKCPTKYESAPTP